MRRREPKGNHTKDKDRGAEAVIAAKAADPILIYNTLRGHFGHRGWWPGETPSEVFIGAVLTQQTTWKNVEKAIANLRDAGCLSMERIADARIGELERLIRPSGYYRQKARRLRNLCRSIVGEYGSLKGLLILEKRALREALLSYSGIGKETADSIVLYAANKPAFVIDAYTKRAMHRINPEMPEDIEYDRLQEYFERSVKRRLDLYKDFHAQFVELGKNYCRKRDPLCGRCPLRDMCSTGISRKNGA